MTKERWLVVRNLEEIPMDVWFEYYLAKGGYIKDFTEFQMYFAQNIIIPITIMVNGSSKSLSFATAIKRINDYYNSIFDL